ncbi:unnamed protein product [Leptidea sinapis]|uniref:PHD-type domain-containing protein n=1 Tax=Leptidea sinapis TaxID=189913 RepID=A0A5E4R244_9NEOP|nr:unnamed protein product [Leptidea sinapis]
MSIVCVEDVENPKEIISVNVLTVADKNDKREPFQTDDKVWGMLFGAVDFVCNAVDPFKMYGVDKYLSALGLVVDPKWRGCAIGKEMLLARQLNSIEFVICHICKKKYHHACINTTNILFTDLSEQYKATWSCPACARPKKDNTNTPVRGSPLPRETTSESILTNATSAVTSAVGPEALRRIIREELNSVLDSFKINILERLKSDTKQVIDQVSCITASLNFLEQKYEATVTDLSEKTKVPICKALGLKVTVTVFTAGASQAVAKKLGYKVIYEITYKELAEKGFVFPGIEENTKSSMLMSMEIK